MTWQQALKKAIPQHKYSINSELLGDSAVLPWSNLGLWKTAIETYPQACQNLAQHLADSLNLNSKDHVVDLGCGQGASLLFWLESYHFQSLSAVELQPNHVQKIQKKLNSKLNIYCDSFLNLKNILPKSSQSAVLCIDAAYHSDLNSLLQASHFVLNSNGRIGFHYLMLSDHFLNLNALQRRKYACLLKAADVNLQHLNTEQALIQQCMNHGFNHLKVTDLSEEVLAGFARYMQHRPLQGNRFDQLKIEMTAKLCRYLYQEGYIRYVEVVGRKGE